ncbi:MAG: response regulator transcription factor [Bacteroidetes bacterium]|nr:response regulator transcription factor [Bacteroidota bacterium]MCH8523433.1 response regulator transcription factor [Balneolales bacterium]
MPEKKPSILLVEDEVESAEMLSTFLEMNGLAVTQAHDGDRALALLAHSKPDFDLAVLDIMVPGADGREICREIRRHPDLSGIPVIFLTAKDEEQDEIAGLTIGADDYIAKPASLNLILAHIKTLLRRSRAMGSAAGFAGEEQVLRVGALTLNRSAAEVKVGDRAIECTAREIGILELLMSNPKKIYSRQQILDYISEDENLVFDRTVDVHIKNIRLKLGDSGRLIRTYRGLGYGIDRDL